MTEKKKYYHSVHNLFVTAKYSLNKIESRILLDLLKRVRKGDTEFRQVPYTRQDIMKFYHGHEVSHREIQDTLKKLSEKQIWVKSKNVNDPKWTEMVWIDLPDYKDGKYILKLSDALIPYLTGLTKNFTLIDIEAMMNMSTHTRRLYMLCRQRYEWKFNDIPINRLIEMMELGDSYRDPRTLRQRILKPAEAEINKLPDIRVTLTVKKKRKINPYYMVCFKVTDENGKFKTKNTREGLLNRHAVKRGSRYTVDSHETLIDLHKDCDKYNVPMPDVDIISTKL